MAAQLGYDGVEVMVSTEPISQDAAILARLSDYHQVPVLAVHAPCLLITQRVWGREPWGKLKRAAEVAAELGAGVVVVHPPFRWQRDYARDFEAGLASLGDETGIVFAVENLYPLLPRRRGGRLRAALEPGRDGRQARHPGPVAHRRVRVRRAGHGRGAGPAAGPRAHGRRHQDRAAGRAPGPGPGLPALRRAAPAAARQRLPRHGRARGQHPPRGRSQERRDELAEALAFTRHNLGQDDLPGGGAVSPPGSASPVRR